MTHKCYRRDSSANAVIDLVGDEQMHTVFKGTDFGLTDFRGLLAPGTYAHHHARRAAPDHLKKASRKDQGDRQGPALYLASLQKPPRRLMPQTCRNFTIMLNALSPTRWQFLL